MTTAIIFIFLLTYLIIYLTKDAKWSSVVALDV